MKMVVGDFGVYDEEGYCLLLFLEEKGGCLDWELIKVGVWMWIVEVVDE